MRMSKNEPNQSWSDATRELLDWLGGQKGGTRTFLEFQDRALALREMFPGHVALLRLLADSAERFARVYEGDPLPSSVANEALKKLTAYVTRGREAATNEGNDYVDLLNEIGRTELAAKI